MCLEKHVAIDAEMCDVRTEGPCIIQGLDAMQQLIAGPTMAYADKAELPSNTSIHFHRRRRQVKMLSSRMVGTQRAIEGLLGAT